MAAGATEVVVNGRTYERTETAPSYSEHLGKLVGRLKPGHYTAESLVDYEAERFGKVFDKRHRLLGSVLGFYCMEGGMGEEEARSLAVAGMHRELDTLVMQGRLARVRDRKGTVFYKVMQQFK